MLKYIRNALGLPVESADPPGSTLIEGGRQSRVSEWASQHGYALSTRSDGRGYQLDGKIAGRPWRMEQGKPTRDFIRGHELRARAEMGLNDEVSVLIINRALKVELDRRAYSLYTDSLQTTVDPNLPEEMRWLALYEEYAWERVGEAFFEQYAVLAERVEHAVNWLTPELAQILMSWPLDDPTAPKILMLLRGKVYLRMQVAEQDMPTVEHAAQVFTTACELAYAKFSTDIAL
jgi:hypothetical protein